MEVEIHQDFEVLPSPYQLHGHKLRPIDKFIHIMYVVAELHQETLELWAKFKLEPSPEDIKLSNQITSIAQELEQVQQVVGTLGGVVEYTFSIWNYLENIPQFQQVDKWIQ